MYKTEIASRETFRAYDENCYYNRANFYQQNNSCITNVFYLYKSLADQVKNFKGKKLTPYGYI